MYKGCTYATANFGFITKNIIELGSLQIALRVGLNKKLNG